MAEITVARITGDWRRVVGDEIVTHETPETGDAGIHGTVTLTPVWPKTGPYGVIADPAAHYSIHPVVCRVRYGRLYDPTNTHPYEDVVVEIGGHPLVWNAQFDLAFRHRTGEPEVPLQVRGATFDSSAMVAGRVSLTGILPAAVVPDEYQSYFTDAAAAASLADAARSSAELAAAAADVAAGVASAAADAAAASVGLAEAQADRAVGLSTAQDEHVAGVLEDQDSATHAALLTVGNANYTRGGALQPAPMAHADIIDLVQNVFVIDRVDGETWGYASGRLYTTPDHGRSWVDTCAAPTNNTIRGLLKTIDGEVIAFTPNYLYKSTGWGTPGLTWTLKLTSHGLATFNRFSIGSHSDGSKFIIGQYGPGAGQAWIDSRYAHISVDGGDTWVQAWDSDAITGNAAVDSHIHAVAYDEWNDRFYVSEGHSVGAGIWHSTDDGATWQRAEGMRCDDPLIGTGMDAGPTVIVPTDDGLVVGSDDVVGGLYGVPRTSDPMAATLQYTWAWRPNRSGTNGFAQRAQRDPETGLVYMVTSSSGPAPVIMAGTANTGDLVWEWPNWTGTAGDFLEGLVIEPGGWIVAYGSEGEVRKSVLGRVGRPVARNVADKGGVLGGRAHDPTSVAIGAASDAHKAIRSVAVGSGAKALGGNGTVVGYGADGGPGTGVVVVGMSSSASSGQAVVIGESVSALGGQATVIGYGASSSSHGEQTAVGNSAQVSGVRTTAMGRGAKATSNQSTAIGGGATASGLRSTAIGQLANTIHTDSIALGQGVATTGPAQVAFGAKHLALLDGATPNAASVAGGGAMWFAGGRPMFRSPSQPTTELSTVNSGTTAARPATAVVGFQYFDTTLGQPVWWNGTAWVDATGTAV